MERIFKAEAATETQMVHISISERKLNEKLDRLKSASSWSEVSQQQARQQTQ